MVGRLITHWILLSMTAWKTLTVTVWAISVNSKMVRIPVSPTLTETVCQTVGRLTTLWIPLWTIARKTLTVTG